MAGIFKDNQPKATLDTWTNKVYPARNQCYQALAKAEGMDPNYSLGWYDLCKKYTIRFKDVNTKRWIGLNGRLI